MPIGLLSLPNSYGSDMLFASGLPLAIADVGEFGWPPGWQPDLLGKIPSGPAIVITSGWFALARRQGFDSLDVIEKLKGRFEHIIGFDTEDQLQIHFSEAMLEQFESVLKINGVYKDLELYNYEVGARTLTGNWTEKTTLRPAQKSTGQLEKLHASAPCPLVLVPYVRSRTRRLYQKNPIKRTLAGVGDSTLAAWARAVPISKSHKTVHFAGSLTHIQRLDALRRIQKSGVSWTGGITSVPKFVGGLSDQKGGELSEEEQTAITAQIQADGFWAQQMGRFAYQINMSSCKAVLSITGHGEYCFRMAEAWMSGRVLVCQDLSHVQSLFPLENGRNAVFCRPNLEDLEEILQDIEANFSRYIPIARQGQEDWRRWCAQAESTLEEAFSPLRRFA